MALIKTSQVRKRIRTSKSQSGFTLLEILIVMGLITFIVVLGAKKLQSPNTSLRKSVNEIAGLSRELHIRSKLTGLTFRLALEMNSKKPDRIWAESSTQKTTFPSEKELKDHLKNGKQSPEQKTKSPFTLDKRLGSRGVRELPENLKIKRVEYAQLSDPIEQGLAYIHYLPEGVVEEAAIHLATPDDSLKWTVAIHPLTGQVNLIEGDIPLKEIQEQ